VSKPKYTTFTGIKAEEIPNALSNRFPPEAYKAVGGSSADLTDINTGFMIERVTAVFGPKGLGWNLIYNPNDLSSGGDSGRTVARLNATFIYSLWDDQGTKFDCAFPVSAVNENKYLYVDEGVRTSCVGAALKWLCFQNDVYKGQFDHHDAEQEKKAAAQQQRANGNGAQQTSGQPANNKAAAPAQAPEPKPDDNDPAPANWEGVKMYQSLFAEAVKLKIKAESISPGKDTKGRVRSLYGPLQAQVQAAQAAQASA
jgi:hypothetical protein